MSSEVIRSHRFSSTYRLSSSVVRVESLGGKVGLRQGGAGGKQWVASGSKLQNGGGARGQGYRPVRQC